MSKQKQKTNFCTQHVLNLYFSGNSMNNVLSYCGLTDSMMRASEKDLLVKKSEVESPFLDLEKIEAVKRELKFDLAELEVEPPKKPKYTKKSQ